MKQLYIFSGSLSRRTPFTQAALYLFFRTMCVFAISLAAAVLLSYFVIIKGTTPQVFVVIVCGWITAIFGFFGGIIDLMNRE